MSQFLDFFTYDPQNPMLFSNIQFWIFLTVLFLGFSILYDRTKLKHAYLLLASLFFYYKSGGWYFFLLLISTLSDYFFGIRIFESKKTWHKKLFLFLSIFINLGLLSYFKYSYFFIGVINQLFGTEFIVSDYAANLFNIVFHTSFSISQIILPVGISFFTFQTISYSVDVYRGKIEPVRNIIDFGFYVSFFPQLVAGPIVRASEFVPQLYKKYQLREQEAWHATFLILMGLIKKVAISDYIAINFVDRVFANPLSYAPIENLMAMYGYSIQIFCDFSGYTDIAIGVALLLGFRLPINFISPYKAQNITDFWRRWHISLSRWLKDYLYISLGGNRKGNVRTYFNLMITMLLGGLWHGASLRFIIWGGIHGLGLVIHKLFGKHFNVIKNKHSIKFIHTFITFHFVSFAWIFFRSSSFDHAKAMFAQIFSYKNYGNIIELIISFKLVFSLMILAYIGHWIPEKLKEKIRGTFIQSRLIIKYIVILIVVLLIYQIKSAELQPFIYFQF